MKRFLVASLLALATLPQLAATPAMAQAPQLSDAETTALARFAMPKAFQGLQQTCRTSFSSDAYMYRSGAAVSAKLTRAANGSWTGARRAILAMVGSESPDMLPLLNSMPPESLQPFAEEMIAGMVVQKFDAASCERVDRILSLLDPLPAENLAALAAMAYAEAQASDRAEALF